MYDIVWAAAGWRYYGRGINNCWEWAKRHWHTKILLAYLPEVSLDLLKVALKYAAHIGDETTFLSLLKAPCLTRAEATVKEDALLNPLIEATQHNRVNFVKALLKAGARDGPVDVELSLNKSTGKYMKLQPVYILEMAATCGQVDIVKALMEADNDGYYGFHSFVMAILLAVRMNRASVVQHLLPSVNIGILGHLVFIAAHNGNATILQMLLSAGDVDHAAVNEALVSAAHKGHVDAVRLLLETGGADAIAQLDGVSAVKQRPITGTNK
ncbi:hypothetical protein HDV00_008814 [Rhizophlyctis rosea]|nr:hypothetical protein HDV00_008814 [Rhizophlyctis rosea]